MDWDSCLALTNGIPSLQCIPGLFQNVITAALVFAGVVALIFIIWSGITYIRSGGDQKLVEGARKTLTYAILGLILVFLSFAIISLISDLTGATCIEEFGLENC